MQERDEAKEARLEVSKFKEAIKKRDTEIDQLKRQVSNYKQQEMQLVSRLHELEELDREQSPAKNLDNNATGQRKKQKSIG